MDNPKNEAVSVASTSLISRRSGLTRRIWRLIQGIKWERVLLFALIIIVPILTFYNLELNPRTWHDEGASLSVSRTVVENGVYAMRNSDGYQTFGPVQSVGPTVLIPVALAFKFFGIGLIQARIVAGIYLLLTVMIYFFSARFAFGNRVALIATLFLICSPAVRIFLYGRQVLGEIPALGFFLAGWWLWARAITTGGRRNILFSGLMFGLAIITKSQYLIMTTITMVLMLVLDLWYYRLKAYKITLIVTLISIGCFAAWQGWQIVYFGMNTYLENAAKLKELAAVTSGFHLKMVINALRSIFGTDTGNFYLYWGFVSLLYAGYLGTRKDGRGQMLAFLAIFSSLWMAYYVLWMIPWQRYVIVPMAIILFFIAKLFYDLLAAFIESGRNLFDEILQLNKKKIPLSVTSLLALGTLVALVSFGLWMGYKFQTLVRSDVMDKVGLEAADMYTPAQLQDPQEVAKYLNANVPKDAVVETWERELVALTDHNYHFPDQSLLAPADEAIYFGGPTDYRLGSDYFSQIQPEYVIIGFYSRFNQIYDMDYINSHYELIKTIGSNGWQYDIYQKSG